MFKSIFTITSTSFTGAVMLVYIFNRFGFFCINGDSYIPFLFFVCLAIALFMSLYEVVAHRLLKSDVNLILDGIIRMLICLITITVGGWLGGLFSFSWRMLFYVMPVLVPVFFVTYFVVYKTCSRYADDINKAINKRKSHKTDG